MYCFNPHARVGRDAAEKYKQAFEEVSIHTPVWGVTRCDCVECIKVHVSIHTPVWGVTVTEFFTPAATTVSIHTPVWGVTGLNFWVKTANTVSIHTPVWGVTFARLFCSWYVGFQSTRPCGA